MPIVVGGIIAGAGAIGGAVISAHAAGKAADKQAAAGEKAIAELKPFQQTGTEAFTTLGGLMGLGGGGGGAPAAPSYDAPITPGQANFDRYSRSGGYIGKDVPMADKMSNPAISTDVGGYTAQQHGAAPTSSSYGAGAPQGGGGMLKVRTPDGRVVQVPVEKAGEAQQNGGTVLGRA